MMPSKMTFKEWRDRVLDRPATTTREYRAYEAWEQQDGNYAKVLAAAKATVVMFNKTPLTIVEAKLLDALAGAVAEVEGKL